MRKEEGGAGLRWILKVEEGDLGSERGRKGEDNWY